MAATSNIILTGFMGTGKTTVGRLLAEKVGFEFVDTDAVIEQRHGPIPDIFRLDGESRFREIEREIAADLATASKLVVATGGRMMLDPVNVAALTADGRVFCLVATAEEIFQRVASDQSSVERPLLAVPDPYQRIVELLAERGPAYRRFTQVSTDGDSPKGIADRIADLVADGPRRFTVDSADGS